MKINYMNAYFENYLCKFYNKEIDENIDVTNGKKNYILSVINLFDANSKIYEMSKTLPILNNIRSNVKFLIYILLMKEENIREFTYIITSCKKWYKFDITLMTKNFLNEPKEEIKDFLIKTLIEKNLLDKFIKYLLFNSTKFITQGFPYDKNEIVIQNILKIFINLIDNKTITNKKTIKLIYKHVMT